MKCAQKTVILVFALTGVVVGQRSQMTDILTDKQTLAGQSRMAVSVEMISIPGYTFRGDIESALRQAGISVLSSTERALVYPLLRFAVSGTIVTRLQPPELNYRISLQFIQLFSASNGKYFKASTWSSLHSGLTPWNGILSGPQVIGDVKKDAMNMLDAFVDDWHEVNGGATPDPATSSHIFDGVWRGTYTCGGLFAGNGQSTWTIREVKPLRVEAEEQYTRFASGHFGYTGIVNGRRLDVTTQEGGYSVQFTISDDGTRLSGRYIGHPNQCQTVSLQKVQ